MLRTSYLQWRSGEGEETVSWTRVQNQDASAVRAREVLERKAREHKVRFLA